MAEEVLSVRSALASHPLFASASPVDLERLSRVGTPVEVDPGYVLARAGRRGYELFLVLEGTATAATDGIAGSLGPGDHFGAFGGDLSATAPATVVACTPMRLIALDARELRSLLVVRAAAPADADDADLPPVASAGS